MPPSTGSREMKARYHAIGDRRSERSQVELGAGGAGSKSTTGHRYPAASMPQFGGFVGAAPCHCSPTNLPSCCGRCGRNCRSGDGVAALAAIEAQAPNLAFLDIHMPLLTGIEVARQITGRCHVAFITSYDQYAIDAFEAGAVGYVLKPPTAARLATTVQHLKARLEQPPADLRRALKDLAQNAPTSARYLQWINASRGATVRLITVEEILYFKSDLKYTLVVTSDAEALIKKTIKELGEELDPTMFWQVHRSTLVNVHAIDSVIRDERGNLKLRLKHRSEMLAVSEAYDHLLRQM